jgi:ubiquinone/menaquinone biosynthesis C-methylase UbiE
MATTATTGIEANLLELFQTLGIERTHIANRIIDNDINPYLLREAEALARRAGLGERIAFQEGHAEAIPLAESSVDVALSSTVTEEGDCRPNAG